MVVHALIYRTKNVGSTSEILVKEIYYLQQALLKNNYLEWIIKEPPNKALTFIINPETGLEVKKNILISIPYVLGLSKEVRRILCHTNCKWSLKAPTL